MVILFREKVMVSFMFSTGAIAQARGPRLSFRLYNHTRIFTLCMYYMCVQACMHAFLVWNTGFGNCEKYFISKR